MVEIMLSAVLISFGGLLLYGIGAIVLVGTGRKNHFQEMYWFLHIYVRLIPILFALTTGVLWYISLIPGTIMLTVHVAYVRWIIAVLFVVWIIVMGLRLRKLLRQDVWYEKRKGWLTPADSSIQQEADRLAEALGLKKKPEIFLGKHIKTAQVLWGKHEVIALPQRDYTKIQMRSILLHELIHCKHGDARYRRATILLQVIFWFNPIFQKLLKSLGKWDEYHCDYAMCQSGLVTDEEYNSVLLELSGEQLTGDDRFPGFHKEDDNQELIERMERIMRWREVKKMKKWMVAVLAMMMCLTGGGLTYASAATLNLLNDWILENSDLGYEEELVEVELIEYEMSEERMVNEKILSEGLETQASSTGTISVALTDATWQTGKFWASSGQTITVAITSCVPTSVTINAGIIEPDGTWRWVNGSGNFSHAFSLDQTGEYRVFVRNKTESKVTIRGMYDTYSEE